MRPSLLLVLLELLMPVLVQVGADAGHLVELDVHLDAHGWPQQRGSRVLRVCYYGVCVCVDSTLPEPPPAPRLCGHVQIHPMQPET